MRMLPKKNWRRRNYSLKLKDKRDLSLTDEETQKKSEVIESMLPSLSVFLSIPAISITSTLVSRFSRSLTFYLVESWKEGDCFSSASSFFLHPLEVLWQADAGRVRYVEEYEFEESNRLGRKDGKRERASILTFLPSYLTALSLVPFFIGSTCRTSYLSLSSCVCVNDHSHRAVSLSPSGVEERRGAVDDTERKPRKKYGCNCWFKGFHTGQIFLRTPKVLGHRKEGWKWVWPYCLSLSLFHFTCLVVCVTTHSVWEEGMMMMMFSMSEREKKVRALG